jgi:hypothetical protein
MYFIRCSKQERVLNAFIFFQYNWAIGILPISLILYSNFLVFFIHCSKQEHVPGLTLLISVKNIHIGNL